MNQVFDDRLEDVESTDELLETGEEIARELARDHATDMVCAGCCEHTPLAVENASDVPKANTFRSLVEDVESKLECEDENCLWVHGEFSNHYIEEYRDSLGDPEDCIVCEDESIEECGHQRHGEPCPAR